MSIKTKNDARESEMRRCQNISHAICYNIGTAVLNAAPRPAIDAPGWIITDIWHDEREQYAETLARLAELEKESASPSTSVIRAARRSGPRKGNWQRR